MRTVAECIAYVESHMETRYATANGAYRAGKKISPKGCVNHSVGCAQPAADVFYNTMNKPSAGWGVNAILGDFHKGEGRILVVMPLNTRPWGCGAGKKGSWNNTKVQWEVCEPAGHTYAGGTMINYSVTKNQTYFDRMWKMLVAWNVYVAVKFGYPVSGISDHIESYHAGYGSGHSDMGHWLPKHGKSMTALRREVEEILNNKEEEELTYEEFVKHQERYEKEKAAKKESSWATEAIAHMKDMGIMQGDANGGFRPRSNVTREELAVVVDRALNIKGK